MPEPEEFDVFLSHNSNDKETVRAIAQKLEREGIRTWLDERQFKGGDYFSNKLYETLDKTEIAFLCLGINGVGPWQEIEMSYLHRRYISSKKKSPKIIPILLPGASADNIPNYLKDFHFISIDSLDNDDEIRKLLNIFPKVQQKHRFRTKLQKQKFQGYKEYIDGIPLEMVLIPNGTFTMGAPKSEEGSYDDERPQHNVTLSEFLMGRYPVTQEQWKAIASRTDLKVNLDLNPDPSRFNEPYQDIDRWQRPVENVNWYEVVEFCRRLSKLTRRNYRLPSEAEWEYACRGLREPLNLEKGESSYPPFHFGETITTDLANYRGTDNEARKCSGSYDRGPEGEYRQQTTPVGYFKVANSFGLSDMHGNVWEWCVDEWHDNYENAPTDGKAWLNGDDSRSPLRGGSWLGNPHLSRSAVRNLKDERDKDYYDIGFRVVCDGGSE
ncbi:MAG: SUMF1/EgtB/PvdO family nonheme iron enzyme [Okeania sp. SIO2D1]|nr:SUMF1/EgtB/PvdO family nonheme iron enzyme [Okeania sp. SIO2D1]